MCLFYQFRSTPPIILIIKKITIPKMCKYLTLIAATGLALFTVTDSYAQTQTPDTLYKNFISPPASAKPRVWWHWMNGNISKEGIYKDLNWMNRAGIGGFQHFDAAMTTPQRVKKRLVFMTPDWQDAFKYATRLADSLKLEMSIAGSPGWSQSGGPWVPPKDGMKKIVWSETFVQGGKAVNLQLPKPPGVTGPFQNIPYVRIEGLENPTNLPTPQYAQDIAVIAYKLPDDDIPMHILKPVVTASGGNFTLTQLTDGDVATTGILSSNADNGNAWIQFAFEKACTIKALTLACKGSNEPALEMSNDGITFQLVCKLPTSGTQKTENVPATIAKYFRVTFKGLPAKKGEGGGTPIAELVLHTVARVNKFEEKAAFSVVSAAYEKVSPDAVDAINSAGVIDLTNKLDAEGRLRWTAPAGNWNVIRFGYSLLGKTNHPATTEGTGLEVDKLDSVAISHYFRTYLDKYKNAAGGLMGDKGGLKYLVTDSWEAGPQNWTPDMIRQFQKRRGYSMIPWMPVITGHIVKSAEASENFLWDLRKTLTEMLVEYHYDQLSDILKEYDMKRYSESHEFMRALLADGMDVKRRADIPMSALWMPSPMPFGGIYCHQIDVRESASVAHIYGQNLVAAESMTTIGSPGNGYNYDPQGLKPTADFELANGLNRFVIHTSAHQPTDDKPGITLGPCGQWFTRNETWAEQAKAWTTYLSRSAYMLQQGKFVADIVYYYGEDDNLTSLFANKLPDIPEGYNYDFINPYALINLLSVKNGNLITPSGMSYRVLVLDDNARRMSLPVLRKLHELVKNGATITGVVPESSPSLTDDQAEFKKLVNEIWHTGNSKIFTNKKLYDVLNELTIAPDFSYAKPSGTTRLLYVHRKLNDGDVYWVNNREDIAADITATFRITGKVPQLWHPESGQIEPVSYTIVNGVTKVDLHLQPSDAVFVIFKGDATEKTVKLKAKAQNTLATLGENWKISFQQDRGAPASINVSNLTSWTESVNKGVKYFSGTATYSKSVSVPAGWLKRNTETWLDLGDVKNLAEVVINGKSAGIIWKKPFRADVSSLLKPGKNIVEVKVTNLWVNRIIGDTQPGTAKRYTYATWDFYNAASPLLPSGLLGPVKIVAINK
jgi:hypothetical protein